MKCEHMICADYYRDGESVCGLATVLPNETREEANERHLSRCKEDDCEQMQILQEGDSTGSEEVSPLL